MERPMCEGDGRRDFLSRLRSEGPPVEGCTGPEFAAEVLGLLRRIAALPARRFAPLEVLFQWLSLEGGRGERTRPDQWKDAQRIRRVLAAVRVDLGLDPPGSPVRTHGIHDNVNTSVPGGTIKLKMGTPSPTRVGAPAKRDTVRLGSGQWSSGGQRPAPYFAISWVSVPEVERALGEARVFKGLFPPIPVTDAITIVDHDWDGWVIGPDGVTLELFTNRASDLRLGFAWEESQRQPEYILPRSFRRRDHAAGRCQRQRWSRDGGFVARLALG